MVAVVTMLGAGVAPTDASAAPTPLLAADAEAARALNARLGSKGAGAYLDPESGRMVVAVTDQAAATRVRASGGVPKLVRYSTGQLEAVRGTFQRALVDEALTPGTAWAVDPVSNQVVVWVDETVTGQKLARVRTAVAAAGDAARLERVTGTLAPTILGGRPLFGLHVNVQVRCTVGFNVHLNGSRVMVTAGHCTVKVKIWRADSSASSAQIGSTMSSSYPGNDYGLVQYTGSEQFPSAVDLYPGTQPITAVGTPYVGQRVQHSGSTSGVHSGHITALNATVVYADGVISGLIRTNICSEPGDSGGPLFAGPIALGTISGGSGNCSSGGSTYYQPINEIISSHPGMRLA